MKTLAQKRRQQKLNARTAYESFCFQVNYAAQHDAIPADRELLEQEFLAVRRLGIAEDLLQLAGIIKMVQLELHYTISPFKNSLNGTQVGYYLRLTDNDVFALTPETDSLICDSGKERFFQVRIAYSNDIRNQVVDWLRENDFNVTTRLGRPVLKLPHMVVEIDRILPRNQQ